MKIARSILVVLVLSVLLLAACSRISSITGAASKAKMPNVKEAMESKDVFQFGVMLPLTGDAAAYGIPLQNAIELAVTEINSNGGISGKPVKLVTEDSKCDPKEGATAAEKLVNVDGVKVIFGGACSGETLGAAPITEAGQVILISPSATSPKVTTAGDYVFRLAPSDAGAGEVAAKFAFNTMQYGKIAIISETTDYAQGLRDVFTKKYTELGGEIVSDQTFASDASDFRTVALKAQVSSPDAIVLYPQTPDKGILLLKELKQAGFNKPILTAEVLIGRSVAKEHPYETDGIVGFEQAFNDRRGKSKEFMDSYYATYSEDLAFPGFQAGAYDSVYLMKEAIELNNGVADTDVIRDYLYNLNGWDGAVGKLTMDGNGDPILSYSVKRVDLGKVSDAGVIRGTVPAVTTEAMTVSQPAMNESTNSTMESETEMNSTSDVLENESSVNMTG